MVFIPPPPLTKRLLLPSGKSDLTWADWYTRIQGAVTGGVAPVDASYVTTQANGTLINEVNLGALPSGYVQSTVSGGIATLSTTTTVAPGPHHTTHETGGSDAITSLAASVITSGTIPDARLSTNVALLNRANVFTQNQQITSVSPLLLLWDSSRPVDGRVFEIASSGGTLYIQALNDAQTTQQGAILMSRTGVVTAAAGVATSTAYAVNVQVGSSTPTNAAQYPMLRFESTAQLGVIKGDASAYAAVMASLFYAQSAGTSLADLTVRGATNFQNGITTTGGANITTSGGVVSTGYVYPGRFDTTASQTTWYLASHAAYGLYSNTGLYLTQTLFTNVVNARAGGNTLADLTVTGATDFRNGVTVSSGNINTTGGLITTGGIFPGRVDISGQQGSWYLVSHGSYGLYTNTGFFITQNCWAAAYPGPSDIRLKDDLGLATDTSALRAVAIHEFTWKADGRRDRGIFAQELDQHIPSVVYHGKTAADPWGIDYSKLVAHVIVGWQEHDRELLALKAEIADLKRTLHAESE